MDILSNLCFLNHKSLQLNYSYNGIVSLVEIAIHKYADKKSVITLHYPLCTQFGLIQGFSERNVSSSLFSRDLYV